MTSYTISKNNNLSASQGTIARVATSAGVGVGVVAFAATDEEAAASVRRLTLERTTGGTVAAAQTPEKLRAESRAADSAGAIDFSVAPTISGSPLITLSYQNIASGPSLTRHWRAHPRFPIVVPPSAFCTLRGTNLAIPVTRTVWFSEPEDTPNWSLRGRRPTQPGYWFHQDHAVATSSLATTPMRNRVLPAFHIVDDATWVYPTPAPNIAALIDSLGGGTLFSIALDGGLTPSGALSVRAQKPLAGSLTIAGLLAKRAQTSLAGTTTPSGALVKVARKPLAGATTPSGTLAARAVRTIALAGSLTPTGGVVNLARKALAGGVTPGGVLSRLVGKPLAGTTTPAGALTKRAAVALAGATTPSGALARRATKALLGSLGVAGALVRLAGKTLGGLFAPSGATTSLYLPGVAAPPPVELHVVGGGGGDAAARGGGAAVGDVAPGGDEPVMIAPGGNR